MCLIVCVFVCSLIVCVLDCMCVRLYVYLCVSSNSSTSDMENNSDDEFFDAEMEGEWSTPAPPTSRPKVMSVPVVEGDPPDVEEEEDYDEEDNASGEHGGVG